jgi:hypothetical protein
MVNIDSLATDTERERGGRWADYEGIGVRLARMNNEDMDSFIRVEADEWRQRHSGGRLDEAAQRAIYLKAVATHVIRDWRDMERDGAPLPYSPETALALIKAPGFKDFLQWVERESTRAAAYRVEARKDAEKNSPSA